MIRALANRRQNHVEIVAFPFGDSANLGAMHGWITLVKRPPAKLSICYWLQTLTKHEDGGRKAVREEGMGGARDYGYLRKSCKLESPLKWTCEIFRRICKVINHIFNE